MFSWLSLFIGIAYVGLGIVVLVYKFFGVPLEPNVAYMLGGLLIVYGIFRFVRSIYKMKQKDE